ncbi:hypothetical protein CBR_g55467 [Chara braunii]|uniref:DUF4220 domain-containing protein n=1 Tax=Chara braunii TaxID=69332 RepID=A0A388K857_CHABU|nr:hypothetical protein CBR_g55467 [Chara braunii]|eukprot:GBG66123.1 hypothetical protein CBR_g55467 [Chara braunii]
MYRYVEVVESGTGYLVLTILSLGLGSFGPDMSARVLWTCVALVLLDSLSKVLRGFIHKVYFHGMSCAQVAVGQGISSRVVLGSFTLLNGKVRSTFAYVALSAFVRLCAMVAQIILGVFLYKAIPEVKGHPDYDKDWSLKRLHEFLVVTCSCLFLHTVLMEVLILFSSYCALKRFWLDHLKGLCAFRTRCPASLDFENLHQTPDFPLWERLERIRAEMEMGVTWYVHCGRHFWFSHVEAYSYKEDCGLPGYWFHSVKELVDMVRDNLPRLSEEKSTRQGRRGRAVGKVSMALASLLELSLKPKPCDSELFAYAAAEEEELVDHMQDLPQTARCRHDVDAGLDFARAHGYLAMLQVLKCCPPNSDETRLAASIVAGFASGLSVLPWQPCSSRCGREGCRQHGPLEMLADDDFWYVTVDLLHEFRRQITSSECAPTTISRPWADHCTPLPANANPDELTAAAASAISSFAQAASDIHAHLHGHRRPCTQPNPLPAIDGTKPQQDEVDKGYVRRLSNGYTTLSADGWPLETRHPDFQVANDVWVNGVLSVLMRTDTVDALLQLASKSDKLLDNLSCNAVAHSIRTLSALFSRRMITWHRFDDRLLEHFPPPMASIYQLSNKDIVKDKLKRLIGLCSEPQVHPRDLAGTVQSVSSRLQLAKILISQGIRDVDEEVAEMLLQCIGNWRRALGPRDVDWLTCEAIETLRDLFVTSSQKSALQPLIWCSPGGVNCLRLMLNDDRKIFDHPLLEDLLHPEMESQKIWSSDVGTHKNSCVAAAAGLLAELMKSPEKGSSFLPKAADNRQFYTTLFMSLSSILDPEKMHTHTDLANASSSWDESASRSWAFYLPQFNLTARFVLLFWESLGNPAWRPAFGLFENINSFVNEGAENRMENFELAVNSLLATRYAVTIADLVLARHPEFVQSQIDHTIVTACFPPLVRFLTRSIPRLQRCLGLEAWEDELHCEIKNQAAHVLFWILPRVYQLQFAAPSRSLSAGNSRARRPTMDPNTKDLWSRAQDRVGLALEELQKWAGLQHARTKLAVTSHGTTASTSTEQSTDIAHDLAELVKELTPSSSASIPFPGSDERAGVTDIEAGDLPPDKAHREVV